MPPQTPQQPSTTSPLEAQPRPVTSTVSTKKRFPKWLKIVGVIVIIFLVIIAIAVVTASIATQAPQKISDQFVNDVQAENTGAAYGLTSKTFQGATSQDQLDSLIKRIGPALQGEEKVSGRAIEKTSGVPATAVLIYTVKTSNGDKYIKVELQENNNVWQVINFRADDKPLSTTVE